MSELNPMLEAADRLKALRTQRDEMKADLTDLQREVDQAERELADMMINSETQNFTHNGTTFCLTNKTRASVVDGFRNELFKALRNTGNGDLVTETVNANSLSSFVKEQLEENDDTLPEWLNGLVNVYEQTTVGVRKATQRK